MLGSLTQKKKLRPPPAKKGKPKKGMTIRYSSFEEIQFKKLMEFTNDTCMSKSFKKTPVLVLEQSVKIGKMSRIIEEQRNKIKELEEVLASWAKFNELLGGHYERQKK